MSVFVVDANVMNAFQAERAAGREATCHSAIKSVFDCGHIALDDGGHCKQEWLECAAGTFPLALEDWIADRLVEQRIQLYPNGREPRSKEMFREGIPRKDHKWVVLAKTSKAVAIVSDDIDFVDCKKKKCDAKTKEKIRAKGKGPTKKWIQKTTGADVWMIEDVVPALS